MKNKSNLFNKFIVLLLLVLLSGQSIAFAQEPQQQRQPRISYNDATGDVSSFGADPSSQNDQPADTATITPTPTATEIPLPEDTETPALPIIPEQSPESQNLIGPGSVESLSASIYYVNINAGNDTNTCTSVALPCQHIQEAVNKSSNGDTVRVATGTYVFSTNPTPNVVIISKSLNISGGWNSTFTEQVGVSIVDGANVNNDILANAATIVMEGFVIQNGSTGNGGGIYVVNGNFTIKNSTLKNNHADGNGGGIFLDNGNLTAINTTLSGNNAGLSGGGIYAAQNSGAIASIQNSTVAYNTAQDGGGISRSNGTYDIINTIVANNTGITSNPDCNGAISTVNYSIIENMTGCTITTGINNLNVDPQIDSNLTGNMPVHLLLAGSPAVNTGSASGCPSTDQRGFARPQGSGCDISSIEYIGNGTKSVNILSGSNQEGSINTAFASNLLVLVLDQNDSPVSGVDVTFTAPASGASGLFSASSTNTTIVTTGAGGVATASKFMANGTIGSYTVTASASGYSPVVFQLNNTPVSDPNGRYVSPTGSDALPTTCSSPIAPCLTIDKAIQNSVAGNTVYVAIGTYTNSLGSSVVTVDKSLTLSGGWDSAFTAQTGNSIIDGQEARRGVTLSSDAVLIDHFKIQNGFHANQGGGIRNSGTLTLNNSIVSGNVSKWMGGGILNYGTLTVNNSTISGNSAGDSCCSGGGGGGGIQNDGTAILNNSTVSGNTILGGHSGSGIYNSNVLTLNNSTVIGNTGGNLSASGVYIVSNGGSITLNNSTISNNMGRGIYKVIGDVILNNSTISGNTIGIATQSGYSGNITMQNTILAGNATNCSGAMVSAGYNLFGNMSGCTYAPGTGDLTNVNPMLTTLPIGSPPYYALQISSSAINAGNPATCLPADQRGVSRPQGGVCDIGAYEYTTPGVATSFSIISGDNQSVAPNIAFAQPLQVAALDNQGSPVSNVNVTFTLPGSGVSGTFTSTGTTTISVLTNEGGVATTSTFTANNQLGDYAALVSASGMKSINFNLKNATWYVATTGNDLNTCTSSDNPCATINGAISKATNNDSISIAIGTYLGSGTEVVLINKSIKLLGGWDASFSAQSGTSTIDGQKSRRGITTTGIPVVVDHFKIQNGYGGGGGGILNQYGALTLSNSIVSGNVSTSMGGGIFNHGTLTISNTTISENSAGDPCCSGGGGGGGIENYTGNVVLNNSTVSGNIVIGLQGSGIDNGTGFFDINNSTVSGNAGNQSIFNFTGIMNLNNSTIDGNVDGGIYNYSGTMTLQNSILANNTTSGFGSECMGTMVSLGYNLISNSSGCTFTATIGDLVGTSDHPINPYLASLQDNGGPTFTQALMTGSPAINNGNPATPGSGTCLAVDQRGVTRPAGSACDIGAFEGEVPAVQISGNLGAAGATLKYTVGYPQTVTSDNYGFYSILVPIAWSGSVVPSKTGLTFVPGNRTYSNLVANQTAQDYATIQDPSFEAYTPNPFWSEYSTNFGTPLCRIIKCGNGGGTALPHTGNSWIWFGGTSNKESGSISQTITLPNGLHNLKLQFYLWIGLASAGSGTSDVFTAKVDGVTVFSANATQQGSYSIYTPVLVDISAFANGSPHKLTFSSTTTGQVVNFNLDDVNLVTATFFDVPSDYWALQFIDRLYNAGITGGCGTGIYCPDSTVTRAQMAVFLLKGMHGSSYTPPAVGASTGFTDVATGYWAAAWIKQLAAEGITGGCGGGNYCPDATVTRAQMAVFLLKAKHGTAYTPPAATGIFTDVPVGYWADKWIEQLASEGITGGCGAGIYCPGAEVTRAQMAVFLVKAFNLP